MFGWAIGPEWCDTTVGFGFSGGCLTPAEPEVFGNTWGVLVREKLKAEGDSIKGKTLAIIADDNDLGRSGIETQSAAFEDVGAEVVYAEANVPGPPAASPADFTPFANELLEADDGEAPDMIMLLMSSLNVLGMDAKLKELGYGGLLDERGAVRPAPDRRGRGLDRVHPDGAVPGRTRERARPAAHRRRASPRSRTPIRRRGSRSRLAAGYWSAEMMLQMMKKVDGDLSQAAIVEAGNDGFVFEVPDTVAKTKWPKAHSQGSPCGTLVEAVGGEYTIAVPFNCGKIKKL